MEELVGKCADTGLLTCGGCAVLVVAGEIVAAQAVAKIQPGDNLRRLGNMLFTGRPLTIWPGDDGRDETLGADTRVLKADAQEVADQADAVLTVADRYLGL